MSAKGDTTVFVLDMGPRLADEDLQNAVAATRLMIERKVNIFPTDDIGLVLVGTDTTDHTFDPQPAYDHITVAQKLLPASAVGMKMLRALMQLPPRMRSDEGGADILSALAIAVAMLMTRIGARKKGKNEYRIVIITGGTEPLETPDEAFLAGLAEQCSGLGIKVGVVALGIDMESGVCTPDTVEKRLTLDALRSLESSFGECFDGCKPLAAELEGLRQPRSYQMPASRASFSGSLELAAGLHIRTVIYKKALEKKLASAKKFSLPARERNPLPELGADGAVKGEAGSAGGGAAGNAAGGEEQKEQEEEEPSGETDPAKRWAVQQDKTHHTEADPEKDVPPPETIHAYRFGHDLVPISQDIEASFKFKVDVKSLQVQGFVLTEQVPHAHMMGNPEMIAAAPGDEAAGQAFAALVTALREGGKVMVVRYVRQKNAAPRSCVCTPQVEESEDGSTSYFFCKNDLPFADEVRLASWAAAGPATAPSAHQLGVASVLVDALLEGVELEPVPNPYLHHARRVFMTRALTPGAPIPDVDPALTRPLVPDPELLKRAHMQLNAFDSACPTSEAAKGEQGHKRARKLATRESEQEDAERAAREQQEEEVAADEPSGRLGHITLQRGGASGLAVGSADPVRDVRAMLDDRTSDRTLEAIKQMCDATERLAPAARDELAQQHVLRCLAALREACVERGLPASYNHTLRALQSTCASQAANSLWARLCEPASTQPRTLISSAEAEESDVPPAEAAAFLLLAHAAPDTLPGEPEDAGVDLLDELE